MWNRNAWCKPLLLHGGVEMLTCDAPRLRNINKEGNKKPYDSEQLTKRIEERNEGGA